MKNKSASIDFPTFSDRLASLSENKANCSQEAIMKALGCSPVCPSLWNIVQATHCEAQVGMEPIVAAGSTSRYMHRLEICRKAAAIHFDELVDGP